jgi:hypothetical protein
MSLKNLERDTDIQQGDFVSLITKIKGDTQTNGQTRADTQTAR